MLEVEVIEDADAAAVALDPIRSRLLAMLGSPASAAKLADRIGVPRQKVTYHLRILAAHKLVRAAGKRRWGGLTERLYVASAASYLVSPDAFGAAAADPGRTRDRLSATYLLALAARVVREVGGLWRRSLREGKRLATLSIDTELRFASAGDRAAFTAELGRAIAALVSRYHDASAPRGRPHRLVVMSYPTPVAAIERNPYAHQE
jgi:DNA-binding transcriptional ArsR family regulator